MACEASGKPPPDVAWIKNGVLESSGKKATFLKFDNINRRDAGQYTCRANNSVEFTSIDTSIVVQCKYILTVVFYFWIYPIYSANPVIGVSYPELKNLFKGDRKQNSTSNLFRLCIQWSQLLAGAIEFTWNHCSFMLLRRMRHFLPSHCFSWTVFNSENGLKSFPNHCDNPKFAPFD